MKVIYIWAASMLLVTLIGLLIREVKQAKLEAEKRRLENEKAHFDRVFKLIYAVERMSFTVAAQSVCPYCDADDTGRAKYPKQVVKVPRRDIHPPPMLPDTPIPSDIKGADRVKREAEIKAAREKREAEIHAAVKSMQDLTNPKAYHFVHQRPGCSDQHECAANEIHWLIESVPA